MLKGFILCLIATFAGWLSYRDEQYLRYTRWLYRRKEPATKENSFVYKKRRFDKEAFINGESAYIRSLKEEDQTAGYEKLKRNKKLKSKYPEYYFSLMSAYKKVLSEKKSVENDFPHVSEQSMESRDDFMLCNTMPQGDDYPDGFEDVDLSEDEIKDTPAKKDKNRSLAIPLLIFFVVILSITAILLPIGTYAIGSESGYTKGYTTGHNDGEKKGKEEGYTEGYSDGQNDVDTDEYYQYGYDDGYVDGQNDAYEEESYYGPSADDILRNVIATVGDSPTYGDDEYSDQRRAADNARDAAVKKQEELKSK